jgi:hypothetical protein
VFLGQGFSKLFGAVREDQIQRGINGDNVRGRVRIWKDGLQCERTVEGVCVCGRERRKGRSHRCWIVEKIWSL